MSGTSLSYRELTDVGKSVHADVDKADECLEEV